MSKDYWFPWTPSKFKADTMHLNDDQELIYRRLIDFYMETGGGIPDNDQALANIARVSIERWAANADVIRAFFTKATGKLQLKRCDGILANQAERRKSHVERGKKGGRPKANKINEPKATAKQTVTTLHNTTVEKKESKSVSTERRPKESYWWAAEVIRLDKPDYLAWLTLYGGTDDQFTDWLNDRDRWFVEKATPQARTNWFISTRKAIEKLSKGHAA